MTNADYLAMLFILGIGLALIPLCSDLNKKMQKVFCALAIAHLLPGLLSVWVKALT
jgi:hypothetical protein